MKYTSGIIILFVLQIISVFSQSERLIEQIAPFAYELKIDNGRLTGPGAELLLYEITRADFFLIGEEKGVAEIPGLTQIIYQKAYDMGLRFTHMAIETSDFSAQTIERLAIDADAAYLLQTYFDNHKGEIPYYEGKEEANMLTDILATAEDYFHIIWGLDHLSIQGTPSIFASLEKLSTDKKATKLALKLQKEMERGNQAALSQNDSSLFGLLQLAEDDFIDLINAFDSTNEVLEIVEALRTTKDLYEKLFNNELSAYHAGRTQWMYQQFQHFYEEANAVEATPPRVIFKMDADLLYRGNIPGTNISSLGNRVTQFAQKSERKSFHLKIMAGAESDVIALNQEFAYDTLSAQAGISPIYRDFAALASDGWRVYDLRSIRKKIDPGSLSKQLAKLMEEYDALIILQGSSPATLH